MPKRTMFTNITPLPPQTSLEIVLSTLQNRNEMIELNPLVIGHRPIKAPRDAPADEYLDWDWQEITDEVNYLPAGIAKGKIRYKVCFHDLPNGMQTHCYASMGVDIRSRWTICGNSNGQPNNQELGMNIPRTGLYLREDADIKCSPLLVNVVRRNLDSSHQTLVERIMDKASQVPTPRSTVESKRTTQTTQTTKSSTSTSHGLLVPISQYPGSLTASRSAPDLPSLASEQILHSSQDTFHSLQGAYPTLRDDTYQITDVPEILESPLPTYQSLDRHQSQFYKNDLAKRPSPMDRIPDLEVPPLRISHSASSGLSHPGLHSLQSRNSAYGQLETLKINSQSPQEVVVIDKIPDLDRIHHHDHASEEVSPARSDLSFTIGAENRFSSISSMPTPPLEQEVYDGRHSTVSSMSSSSEVRMSEDR